MRMLTALLSASLVLGGSSGCASRDRATENALTRDEITAFMESYERELAAHDREAIIARYDPEGVFILGDGTKEFWPGDSVGAFYRTAWTGPEFFEFLNLSFEPLGADAVLVAGQFRWKAVASPDTALFSYTGLIRRTTMGLRIRLEDESTRERAP